MSQFSSQQHRNAIGMGHKRYSVTCYLPREVTAHARHLYHLPFSCNINARNYPLRKITPVPLRLKLKSTKYRIYSIYSVLAIKFCNKCECHVSLYNGQLSFQNLKYCKHMSRIPNIQIE